MTLVADTGGNCFLVRATLRELSRSRHLHGPGPESGTRPRGPTVSNVAGELTDRVAYQRLFRKCISAWWRGSSLVALSTMDLARAFRSRGRAVVPERSPVRPGS
jgi:hypothetical protein